MGLLIVRHGDASVAAKDSEREFSDLGRADIKDAANFLIISDYTADRCLVSPYVRTQQTLKVLGSQIELGECSTSDALVPEHSLEASVANLEAAYHGELAIISHQPLVSKLVAWCLTSDSYDLQVPSLPPGEMAYIEMDIFAPVSGRLSWLRVPPDYTVTLR